MNSATCHLCEEMLIEIMRRLPVKSLVRFTAVCRRWKSIITCPQFRLQSSQSRPTKLLVHTGEECYALVQGDHEDDENDLVLSETIALPFKHRFLHTACFVGSVDGLVCIVFIRTRIPRTIIIWNPSIRKHAVIPPKDDLNEYIVSHGFGATISGNDYKYVRFVALYDGYDRIGVAVDIYSWKTGTWRRIYNYEHMYFSTKSASLRGRLHWAAAQRSQKINSISVLDLENDVFDQDIMLPECFSPGVYFFLGVSLFVTKDQSQLAMAVNEDGPNRAVHYCSVWAMQEYGDVNSWTKLVRIDLAAMVNVDRVLGDVNAWKREDDVRRVPNAMVHLLKNGELLLGLEMVVGVDLFPPKLVKYDPKTSKATNVIGGVADASSELRGFTNYYKESLVFLTAHDDHRVLADHEVLSGRGSAKRRVRRKQN